MLDVWNGDFGDNFEFCHQNIPSYRPDVTIIALAEKRKNLKKNLKAWKMTNWSKG